ncbi:MAG: FAD-dependent oxidoreductase [Oscillospiraceae bacterium]|jgi:thioredoxin reductase (NADPH)|nr:FAD-dependent oxidoreductase [Oscillospiraceae bacterium]
MITVIGCGPAGVSAAIYACRSNLETRIVGTDQTSLATAERIENYYGFAQPITGRELFAAGLAQAARLGCCIVNAEVHAISFAGEGHGFRIFSSACEFQTDAIVLATGHQKARLDVCGLAAFDGRGVSYCAICDAFFFRGKQVAVIGNGGYAVAEARELLNVTQRVKILTNGLDAAVVRASGIDFDAGKLKKITGDTRVRCVVFEDGRELELDAVFVAVGVASSTDLAKKLGILLEEDRIVIDDAGATNLPGVFAAGDCANKLRQISCAVAGGTIAGLSAARFVRGKELLQ